MKSLTAIKDLAGKTVLVRVDYNVPIKDGKLLDSRRVAASYASIDFLLKKHARVVLIAHLGNSADSLAPVAIFLKKKYKVAFITEPISSDTREAISNIPAGTVVLLENVRRYAGEEKNNKTFAKQLASVGDIYVNDAFSVSHRMHASVVAITHYLPSYAGFQLEKEITMLSSVLAAPPHPFLFMLGGAKFDTKIPLLKRFAHLADEMVIAGAILNSFYKVSGFEVGKSVVDNGFDSEIKKMLASYNLLLPIDVQVLRGTKKIITTPYDIEKGDVIVDIGPQSVALIAEKVKKARLIVWNGPTGWYEKGFTKATTDIAKAIAKSKAQAIIGGGDTGAVIEKAIGESKRIFISTGGGATLDFLAQGTLPGITALA